MSAEGSYMLTKDQVFDKIKLGYTAELLCRLSIPIVATVRDEMDRLDAHATAAVTLSCAYFVDKMLKDLICRAVPELRSIGRSLYQAQNEGVLEGLHACLGKGLSDEEFLVVINYARQVAPYRFSLSGERITAISLESDRREYLLSLSCRCDIRKPCWFCGGLTDAELGAYDKGGLSGLKTYWRMPGYVYLFSDKRS